MKIVLVQPPALMAVDNYSTITQPPLGIAYLAAYAREHGFEVSVVDAVGEAIGRIRPWPRRAKRLIQGLSVEETAARVPEDADVVGVSCMFTHAWPLARDLMLEIKRVRPRARLIAGGEHVTPLYAMVIEQTQADACVLGEGEMTLVEVLEAWREGRELAGIKGVAYRGPAGVVAGPRRERISDLDALPLPAWDLVDPMAYLEASVFMAPTAGGRSIPMLATRGCPFRCTFCSSANMWTQVWKARKPALVVDEMERWMKRYGANDFQFQDLTAIVRKDWIVAFCKEIMRRRLKITWSLPVGTRSEAIDGEVAELLVASGCHHVTYAPESASETVLKAIEKRVHLGHLEDSVRSSLAAGMKVCLFMIVGFPRETWADIRQTLAWIRRMARKGAHEIAVSTFVPMPGTQLFREVDAVTPVRVDDEYCHWMTGATSLLSVRSWSPILSDGQLRLLKLFAMGQFYLISFLWHPSRLWRVVANFFTGRQDTKVDRVIREFWVKLTRRSGGKTSAAP